MAQINVGDLTTDEMDLLLKDLITHMSDYKVRDILMEELDETELEELQMACEDKLQEIENERNAENGEEE